MEVVNFSKDDYIKAQTAFEKQLNNSIKTEPDNGSFLIDKNKEKQMKKDEKTETPVELDNGIDRKTVTVTVSQHDEKYDDDGKYIGSTDQYDSKTDETIEQTPENAGTETSDNATSTDTSTQNTEAETPATEDNSCAEKNACEDNEDTCNEEDNACKSDNSSCGESAEEKCAALEEKCSAQEKQITALTAANHALTLKCSDLEAFKTNIENADKEKAIACALDEVSDVLSAEDLEQWKAKSLNCSNVDAFRHELKSYAFDLQKHKEPETLRNSIPVQEVNKPSGIWDTLATMI